MTTADVTGACFLGRPRRPGRLLAPVDSGSMGWGHQTELVTWTELGGNIPHTGNILLRSKPPMRELRQLVSPYLRAALNVLFFAMTHLYQNQNQSKWQCREDRDKKKHPGEFSWLF